MSYKLSVFKPFKLSQSCVIRQTVPFGRCGDRPMMLVLLIVLCSLNWGPFNGSILGDDWWSLSILLVVLFVCHVCHWMWWRLFYWQAWYKVCWWGGCRSKQRHLFFWCCLWVKYWRYVALSGWHVGVSDGGSDPINNKNFFGTQILAKYYSTVLTHVKLCLSVLPFLVFFTRWNVLFFTSKFTQMRLATPNWIKEEGQRREGRGSSNSHFEILCVLLLLPFILKYSSATKTPPRRWCLWTALLLVNSLLRNL